MTKLVVRVTPRASRDAVADLGPADEIATVFTSFQKYLYQATA